MRKAGPTLEELRAAGIARRQGIKTRRYRPATGEEEIPGEVDRPAPFFAKPGEQVGDSPAPFFTKDENIPEAAKAPFFRRGRQRVRVEVVAPPERIKHIKRAEEPKPTPVEKAKAVAEKQPTTSRASLVEKFNALTSEQKTPRGFRRRGPSPKGTGEPFTQVFSASSKATIPKTPGFYTTTKRKTTESGGTPSPGPKKYMLGTWSKGVTTTSLYARLEDGSLVLMGKSSVPWSKSREAGGSTGPTHEQRLGAQKLSKEKGVPYEQALGLVSASGYYDKNAIVQLPGPSGYGIYDPKTGKRVWGTFTPEVTSALKKLKPFQKPDGTYDWAKIVATDNTQVAIAVKNVFGMELPAQKGIRQSIEAYPELGKALSEGGWEGYQAKAQKMQKEWEAKLKEDSPELYEIYKKEGLVGVEKFVEATNAEYKAFKARVKSGELILLPDGQYIEKTGLEKMPEGAQQILKEEGFKGYEALLEPDWENIETHKVITQTQYQQMVNDYDAKSKETAKKYGLGSPEWEALGPHPTSIWRLTPESGQRKVIELVSFIAPAARAGLKEYTIKDITAIEWGLTAVNTILLATAFAPGAILGSLAARGAVSGVSTAGAGMVGYLTAKDWAKLTPAQRALGVGGTILYSLPMLGTIVRGVRITPSPSIPTVKGAAPTWKGLTIANNPIIGRSGGKWVIGARNITLPEARLILDGYKPEMMLETKVFVNEKVLAKAGFSQTQIDYLTDSLRVRNLFAGKKSPFVAKEVLMEPTKYIDADEMGVMLRQIAKYNKKVEHVDMLYGGTTIKAQLAPELRGWRQLHDLDMHTTFKLEEAQAFVQETLEQLKKLPGNRQYRISPKSSIRIEKLVDGKWEHINDLKSEFIDPSLQASDIPGSKLDVTGEYSYGRMVSEPTITVKYPGVGKFDIMSLSESGVRKADTILRVRQIKTLTPREKYIATGGYKYGQDLVNHLAATYDLKAYPVSKLRFWKRLIHGKEATGLATPPKEVGFYADAAAQRIELAPTLEKSGEDLAEVALHELAHTKIEPVLTGKGGALEVFKGTPEYTRITKFLEQKPSSLKEFLGARDAQGAIENAISELAAMRYVERLADIPGSPVTNWYAGHFVGEMEKLGGRSLASDVLSLARRYADSLAVPHHVPIPKAWEAFKQNTAPKYAQIWKQVTAFRPPERGIAQPGVPKDAADYYVILRTFEEAKVLKVGTADEWLESWAKAMGYTKGELTKVLPKLRKAAQEVANKTPSSITGYRFTPSSKTSISPGASPVLTIHMPSSLGASVSSSLAKHISTPVSLYSLSPKIRPSVSVSLSKLMSKLKIPAKVSSLVSAKLSPRLSKVSVSTRPSLPPSVSPKVSPSAKASISPSIVSKALASPKPSPKPSPIVSPAPTTTPSPSPVSTRQPPSRGISPKKGTPEAQKQEAFRGALTWYQGKLGKGRAKKKVYIAIKEPYKSLSDLAYFIGKPPPGAIVVKDPDSAYETIQQITGEAPEKLLIDMGIMDVKIKKPTQSPGTKGAIAFSRDVKQSTTGTITIGQHRLRRGPEHTSDISLRRHPQDTKEAHAAEAAEKAEAQAAKTKVKVVKVRARARAQERGKPMSRETSPLVRRIQSAGGRTLAVEEVPAGSTGGEVVSTSKSGKQRIEMVRVREPRGKGGRATSSLVRTPKGDQSPNGMSYSREGKIFTATEKGSGTKMYSRRPFRRRLSK